MRVTLEHADVELVEEGAGRYDAFLSKPGRGRVRIGLILGGRDAWVAERRDGSMARMTTRGDAARDLGLWALSRPLGAAFTEAS